MTTGWTRRGLRYYINNTQTYYGFSKRIQVTAKYSLGFFSYWAIHFFHGPAKLLSMAQEKNKQAEEKIFDYFMEDEEQSVEV